MMSEKDALRPKLATIKEVIDETSDVKTFRVRFVNDADQDAFKYLPGQFAELSVFGVGEATISITSTITRPEVIEFCIKKTGEVSAAFHGMSAGDIFGLRGPYGNNFPLESLKGKDLVFIGGGFALAPLRGLINYCIDNRADYGRMSLIYGARSPQDLCFKYEVFENWPKVKDFTQTITVDKGDDSWTGQVGFVPAVLREVAPSSQNAVTVTCGPPIMIKFVLEALEELGFTPEQIITTLELKMKCGIGQCGRCNIGAKYVCLDGPVFSLAQLKTMNNEY